MLQIKIDTLMSLSYVTGIDGNLDLNEFDMAYYQELISALCWETNIGSVDILL